MAVQHNTKFLPGEYVKGVEFYDGNIPIEMRGWVSEQQTIKGALAIEADDDYGGARNSVLRPETVVRCNRVKDWEKANKRTLPMFHKLRHFKGGLYQIIAYANHVDYGRCVVYQSLEHPEKVWVREYAEFMSKVDREKYPNVEQFYRMEEV